MTEKTRKFHITKNLILVTIVAAIFSSLTLWLLDSWVKFPFFFLEIFIIIITFLIVQNYNLTFSGNLPKFLVGNFDLLFNFFLAASAFLLIFLSATHIEWGIIQLIFSLLITSLLPGYAILNLFNLKHYFTKIEGLVLSFVLSYIFTGILALLLLSMTENIRVLIFLVFCILLGVFSAIKSKKQKTSFAKRLSTNIDILAIIVIIVFFVLSFYLMYPGFTFQIGTDISRHYSNSIVLGRTPDLYIGSSYLLSDAQESVFLNLSNSNMVSAQVTLVFLNLILPIAFYVMAKATLERIDRRLPSLATLFWVLFTNSFGGFAWLYLANLKLSAHGLSQLQILIDTADKTYNGTIYGILGLTYGPEVISFILLIVAIFLMHVKEISSLRYVVLFSSVIFAAYLTHVAEATVFVLFLAIYGLISENDNVRIADSLKSSIIGFLLIIPTYYGLTLITSRFIINLPILISILAPIVALSFSLVFRKKIRLLVPSHKRMYLKNIFSRIDRTFILVIFFAYVVAFFSWIMIVDSFHTSQVNALGVIPWFMYPLMLGINGLMGIVSIFYLKDRSKTYKLISFFIAFIIFAFIIAKTVSISNLYFLNTSFWEKRFIELMKISLAILAPIPIVFFADRIKKKHIRPNSKIVISTILISLVVLCGISTTFLNVEYWNIVSNLHSSQPSSHEMNAMNYLSNAINNDPKAWVVSVTATSCGLTTFAAPPDTLGLTQLLYTANTPEMSFTQFYRDSIYSHPYLYLDDRDSTFLKNYNEQFLTQYIRDIPIVYSNSETKIYNISKLSPPQPNSDNVLVIPFDKSIVNKNDVFMAYNILSQGFYNYTVAYDLDKNVLDSKSLLLSFDPLATNAVGHSYQDNFNQPNDSWTNLKGKWQVVNGKMSAGENSPNAEGLLLSHISAVNFSSSFKIIPNIENAADLNYCSLIYSFADVANYRYANILFNPDGYIYISIVTMVNGVETALPKWPGTKTDLMWTTADEYNVTVNITGNSNQVLIDGKSYACLDLPSASGKVGLRYYRLSHGLFDDFSLNYTTSVNTRQVEEYLSFIEKGGRIIVLNTNGYGYFGDSLFSLQTSSFNPTQIDGKLTIELPPTGLITPEITLKNSSDKILSQYISYKNTSPFIVSQKIGTGELVYVNVYPIINEIEKTPASLFYNILGSLLNEINLPKIDANSIYPEEADVNTIYLGNNSLIETTSILFPSNPIFENIKVETAIDNFTFFNVTNIDINNYTTIGISADNVTINNGQGFYSLLSIKSPFSFGSSDLMRLSMITGNETIHLTNITKLSFTSDSSVKLLARTPSVIAKEVNFVEFYSFGNLQTVTNTYGQNLKITGTTKFSVVVSDSYSVLKNVSFNGLT